MTLLVTFPQDLERYNGKYSLNYKTADIEDFKIIYTYNFYAILIDTDNKKYVLVDPHTHDLLQYKNYSEMENEFLIKYRLIDINHQENLSFFELDRIRYRVNYKKLENYTSIPVHIERVMKSLFESIYEDMFLEERLDYLRLVPEQNVQGLKGIKRINDVKIHVLSDNIDEILNCDCMEVSSGSGTDFDELNGYDDYFAAYLFIFNMKDDGADERERREGGYIEVIYQRYFHDWDLGCLFRPYSSKIVLNGQPLTGFFKDMEDTKNFLSIESIHYFIAPFYKTDKILQFIVGMDIPKDC